jgi:hypothetical protein
MPTFFVEWEYTYTTCFEIEAEDEEDAEIKVSEIDFDEVIQIVDEQDLDVGGGATWNIEDEVEWLARQEQECAK